jgi:putative hydrolase of the HAD superfamily
LVGRLSAVFFDVDFTLIYPGPTFRGDGYERFGRRYGMTLDSGRFQAAIRAASSVLDAAQDHSYDPEIFVNYARRIIEEMGGSGPRLDECAAEVYREWAGCQHFHLYDDVAPVLHWLAGRGLKIGLISNSHRCLASFQAHFELGGVVSAAVSSSEHGFMKPHPSIFHAALTLVGVEPGHSLMVGDSVPHDIDGARRIGMRGVLVHRSPGPAPVTDVPVISSLTELPALLPEPEAAAPIAGA